MIKHALVICSFGRPKDVVTLLKQVENLPSAEHIKKYIVENSGKENNLKIIEDFVLSSTHHESYQILQTNPGLPTARNAALRACDEEFIHFLDDDVELKSDYFQDVEAVFNSYPEAIGMAPRITFPSGHNNRLFRTKMQKLLHLEGKVSSTGRAYWISKTSGLQQVEWLPGCAMSFRRGSLGDLKFSDILEKGPLGGYALGEDLDFTFRLSRKGTLLGVNELEVMHKLHPNQRTDWALLDEGLGRFLAYFEREFPEESKPIVTKLSLLLDTFYLCVRGVSKSNLTRNKIRNPFIRISAYHQELRYPKLIP